jgi:hypothetical protein
VFTVRDATRLTLGGLGVAESAVLIEETSGVFPSAAVAASLTEAAAGNPLAFLEACRTLSPDHFTG